MYALMTFGSFRTSAGVPSLTFRPASMKMTRSQTCVDEANIVGIQYSSDRGHCRADHKHHYLICNDVLACGLCKHLVLADCFEHAANWRLDDAPTNQQDSHATRSHEQKKRCVRRNRPAKEDGLRYTWQSHRPSGKSNPVVEHAENDDLECEGRYDEVVVADAEGWDCH